MPSSCCRNQAHRRQVPRRDRGRRLYRAQWFGQRTTTAWRCSAAAKASGGAQHPGFPDEQARVIAAVSTGGLRVIGAYFPNGRRPKRQVLHRDALARRCAWVAQPLAPHPQLVLTGDFNIAPEDRDVYDPWHGPGRIHCTPGASISAASSRSACTTPSASSSSRPRAGAGGTTATSRSAEPGPAHRPHPRQRGAEAASAPAASTRRRARTNGRATTRRWWNAERLSDARAERRARSRPRVPRGSVAVPGDRGEHHPNRSGQFLDLARDSVADRCRACVPPRCGRRVISSAAWIRRASNWLGEHIPDIGRPSAEQPPGSAFLFRPARSRRHPLRTGVRPEGRAVPTTTTSRPSQPVSWRCASAAGAAITLASAQLGQRVSPITLRRRHHGQPVADVLELAHIAGEVKAHPASQGAEIR